jgi:succinate dehydrogenase/fumarate reductase cytochrome b subunit
MIVNPLITLLFALAVVYFLYGVLEFFMNQENEEKKTQSKSHMLWGIIGITIMLGVFAIINIILKTFNISGIKIDKDNSSVQLKP